MPQPENQTGVVSPLVRPKRGLLELIIFSYGSFVLGLKIPLYIMGLIGVFMKFDFAQIKDFPQILILAPVGVLFLFQEGGWVVAGLTGWLLLALGSIIYLTYYFPQNGQRPWERCLAFVVRACGGGAAAFGVALNLWSRWELLRLPDNGEQSLYSLTAVIAACVIGFFGAMLVACWPLFAKTRA